MAIRVVNEVLVDILETADSSLAVSAARHLAVTAGFKETDGFLIASAVSELAVNICKYAGTGRIRLRILKDFEKTGFEVEARDSGPGLEDIEKAMSDNWSTGGSLGLGLPSVKRIMDEFEIESLPGQGLLVIGRKWRN